MAQVLTGENLLVWPRLDLTVDDRVARRVQQHILHPLIVVCQLRAVEKRLCEIPDPEIWSGAGEVVAARNGDGAEPLLVRYLAILTASRERVLRFITGVTGNLLKGVREIFEKGGGVVVVDFDEVRDVDGRVRGNGVGDVGAEGEVVDYGTVSVCMSC